MLPDSRRPRPPGLSLAARRPGVRLRRFLLLSDL